MAPVSRCRAPPRTGQLEGKRGQCSQGKIPRRRLLATLPVNWVTWDENRTLLAQGRTARDLSAVTGSRAYWIGQIATRYTEQGPAGMQHRRHTTSYRPPPVLSLARQEELRVALAEAAARNEPGTGGDVAAWMAQRLGRPVSYHLGWSYLVRLTHSVPVPRPRHAVADAAQQDTLKKTAVPC